MHKFIYCVDQAYTAKLIGAGFKLIKVMKVKDQDCSVFANNAELKTFQFDIDKAFFSDKLSFN